MQSSFVKQDGQMETIELADQVFSCGFNESLIHQVVCYYSAGARQGTHAQKTRAEVSGGGKKPWRQKGTGRARAGSIRSPLWRGGGAAFAVKPRDYSQKINKKMYRGAMRSILSTLLDEKRLIITDAITLSASKTKVLVEKLSTFNAKHALLVLDHLDESVYLASRNLAKVKVCFSGQINPIDLIKYSHTIMTLSALKKLEEELL